MPSHTKRSLLAAMGSVLLVFSLGCGGIADVVHSVLGSDDGQGALSAETPSRPIHPSYAEDGGLSTLSKYGPQQSIDNNPHTSWCVPSTASLKLHFSGTPTITALQFLNGRQKVASDKYGDRYYYNNRAERMELAFSNGHRLSATLPDSKSWQNVDVGAQSADWVQITIQSSYYGNGRKPQHCLTDITVLGH